ncbi:hypothetical protein ACFE6N_23320 [Pedobacter sp. BG31]|uniref:hypothetical protein n=1 Tax=Pedobacter sp. BG31 TaxID=3349697 RepID=UPI0035F22421
MKQTAYVIVISMVMPLLMYAQETSNHLVNDVAKMEGLWKGSLTYLDYRSGKPYTMPADIEIKRIASTNRFLFIHTYPNEQSANSTDTLTISNDGRYFGDAPMISRKVLLKDDVQIITEKMGTDGNDGKKATIRQTYILGKNNFSKRKDVRYAGEKNWIKRHEYSYNRP